MVRWVRSLAEPPENVRTLKQFLKLSTDSFFLLSGQDNKYHLTSKKAPYPGFISSTREIGQARLRNKKPVPYLGSRSSNHHLHLTWEKELFYPKITPWYPHCAHRAPPTPSGPQLNVLVRTKPSSLQNGVSGSTRSLKAPLQG